jgi:hypothetical protein
MNNDKTDEDDKKSIFTLEWWMGHETLTIYVVSILASTITAVCLNILLLTKFKDMLP